GPPLLGVGRRRFPLDQLPEEPAAGPSLRTRGSGGQLLQRRLAGDTRLKVGLNHLGLGAAQLVGQQPPPVVAGGAAIHGSSSQGGDEIPSGGAVPGLAQGPFHLAIPSITRLKSQPGWSKTRMPQCQPRRIPTTVSTRNANIGRCQKYGLNPWT